ncbi:hypothetical protein ACWCQZ_41135 [Streptomyces sp. NPDC002285]
MGYQLRRDLREALGPDVTGLQRAVALEIADDANEGTRISWAALEDLARWTGAKDTVVVRNALKRLAAAGWEFRIPIGRGKDGRTLYAVPGTRMTFKVPTFTPLKGVAVATPYPSKEEQELPQGVATATPEGGQGVATAHSEGAVAHSEGATATPYSSDSSTPHKEEGQRGRVTTATATAREITAEEKLDFGRFWQLHPKSRDMSKTRTEWVTAVVAGADPKQITAAAEAYAREVTDTEFRFVKQSANWLRERRYEDKYAPAPSAPKPSGQLPPWCGECADGARAAEREGHLRQIYDDRGNARPCPKCHPSQAIHAA